MEAPGVAPGVGPAVDPAVADDVTFGVADAVLLAAVVALAELDGLGFIREFAVVPTHRPASLYTPPHGHTKPCASGPTFAA